MAVPGTVTDRPDPHQPDPGTVAAEPTTKRGSTIVGASAPTSPDRAGHLDRIYQTIVNEEDARVCTDISDAACRYVPRNFFLILVSSVLTKLGDLLASPKTVLAWLLPFVQAPVYLVAWLVPIRESGSLIPQLVIAAFVRRRPRRKSIWVVGSVMQCAAIMAMAVVAATMTGALAGWCIMLCLIVFSLSRGLCSVASKDVIGKTIPKTRRGRLTGLASTVAGLASVVFGLFMFVRSEDTSSPAFFGALLASAGCLWIIAAITYAMVDETAGETGGGGNALVEALRRLDLLRSDRTFRHFVVTRALLLCSALSAPYYVLISQIEHGNRPAMLGAFIVANGLASSLSATFWGFQADASSRRVIMRAGALAGGLGVAVFLIATFVPPLHEWYWTYPIAFLVLGIAHSGVRIGRKTYLVDMASGNRRTDYVAVSNTVIGVILLLTGAIGALSSILTPASIVLILSLMGLTGTLLGSRLPEVE
jgi:MFS family permease